MHESFGPEVIKAPPMSVARLYPTIRTLTKEFGEPRWRIDGDVDRTIFGVRTYNVPADVIEEADLEPGTEVVMSFCPAAVANDREHKTELADVIATTFAFSVGAKHGDVLQIDIKGGIDSDTRFLLDGRGDDLRLEVGVKVNKGSGDYRNYWTQQEVDQVTLLLRLVQAKLESNPEPTE